VKPSKEELSKRAEEAIRSCLAEITYLNAIEVLRDASHEVMDPDLVFRISLPDRDQILVIEAKNSGQPRLTRDAVNQLLRYREKLPGAYGVFVAPFISKQAAKICESEGIGYADFGGNCRLLFDRIYIEKEGRPNLFAVKRDLRSLYSAKAERILRVLLSNPKRIWKLKELSVEAKVSLGQVSNVKKLLANREWIQSGPNGLTLAEPLNLLREWGENYSSRRNSVQNFYSLESSTAVETALAEVCTPRGIRYALTGFSGAARLAPAVRYQRASAYVKWSQEEELVTLLGLKAVSSGANVSLITPYDEGVFYGARAVEGIQIASPIQIYLDLLGFRGRGEEAAKSLLEEVILPQW
jgi:hypothetical protein